MLKTDLPWNVCLATPDIPASVWVAPGARVTGDVRFGNHASIWYNAVLRGDINYIAVGDHTNIQDGVVVHVENDRPCHIGSYVTVGHGAILHGCDVADGVLIGMGAIVLSGAVIGKGSIIAAGALIKEGDVVEPYSLMAGLPARRVRSLPESTWDGHLAWAAKYEALAKRYLDSGNG
ncbi:MAG: gamma carbonic anhydrase family protein [Candidatus Margulisiibacteriota bacterium]